MTDIRWLGTVDGDAINVNNYSPAQLPIDDDTLIIEHNDALDADRDIDTNLDGLAAVRLALLVKRRSYLANVGTQAAYLEIGFAEAHLEEHAGQGSPGGSPRLKIDIPFFSGEAGPRIIVHGSCQTSQETFLPPIRLLTDATDAQLIVRGGTVGLAVGGGETSAINAVQASGGNVVIGEGVTFAGTDPEIVNVGATVRVRTAVATIENQGGTLTTEGNGAVTTIVAEGGTVNSNSSGTVSKIWPNGGTVDLTRSREARTVTDIETRAGATGVLKYDPDVVTVTNAPVWGGPVQISLSPAA